MKTISKTSKLLILLFLSVITITSCNKKNDPTIDNTPEVEAALIQDWLDAMIAGKQNVDTSSTGLYYIADSLGTDPKVKIGDQVTVKYTGMYLDGTIFDASAYHGGNYTYIHKDTDPTKRLIQGWEEAIEILGKGGKAAFLIPSDKAYGSTGGGSIPPYTPLIFIIEVVDIAIGS